MADSVTITSQFVWLRQHRQVYEQAHGKDTRHGGDTPAETVGASADTWVGTQHENRMEQVRRGVNPKQKLTWEEAELIRWCRRQGPRVGNYGWNKRVAKICGVSWQSIGALLRNETFTEAH